MQGTESSPFEPDDAEADVEVSAVGAIALAEIACRERVRGGFNSQLQLSRQVLVRCGYSLSISAAGLSGVGLVDLESFQLSG